MTGKPPDPLPDPGLVLEDGAMLPGQEALEAWQRAYLNHQKRLRAEDRRWKAECARLRGMFGPPAGAGAGVTFPAQAWAQDPFDDAAVPADDEEDHRDRGVYQADLPPCERTD